MPEQRRPAAGVHNITITQARGAVDWGFSDLDVGKVGGIQQADNSGDLDNKGAGSTLSFLIRFWHLGSKCRAFYNECGLSKG